tara:strand:+ start:7730 stop:8635 length:906 start_codon:yes stop_codon:yes gene_type:complete
MALGDIWLAASDGSCSSAGTCVAGACGPGDNPGDLCPTYWEHTATYQVDYEPGGSVKINSIPINPGEVYAAVRGDLTIATPLEYPVEYYRAEIVTPPPIVWDPEVYKPSSFKLFNDTDDTWGSPTGITYVDIPDGVGSNWPSAPGVAGQRYGGGTLGAFGYAKWIYLDGGVWRRRNRTSSNTNADDVAWGEAELTATNHTTGAFIEDYVVTFLNNSPGDTPDPLPGDLISWGVVAYPSPRQQLINTTNYGGIPLLATPGEVTLGWGKFNFADQLSVNNYPTTKVSGAISLTLRSACENPAP